MFVPKKYISVTYTLSNVRFYIVMLQLWQFKLQSL